MKVPFLDLKGQYESIKDEVSEALQAVLDQTAFAGGPFVNTFEQEYAEAYGVKHCVANNSGTTALWLPLLALNVAGGEVITVSNTFIATCEAITFAGATPVFVEVDESTYTMDPAALEAAITPKTKAIIPVHLYGQMADLDPILEVAHRHNIPVIEDCAQGHCATYKGRSPGQDTYASCFSFYPGKNMGAYGEGGATITNNDELAKWMRMFRDHGQAQKYYHDIVGFNCRMDGFQAAVLSIKLKYIEQWTEARRRNAGYWNEFLKDVPGITLPVEADYARHVYHLYVIRVEDRDQFIEDMKAHEVFCGIHYPVPVHLQKAYDSLGLKAGTLPLTEKISGEIVSLPMFPELTREQISYAADCIKKRQAVSSAR